MPSAKSYESVFRPALFHRNVAIVTGAGRGLGRAYARQLAARGCRVVVNDPGVTTNGQPQSEGAADEVVAEILAAGGPAVADRSSGIDGADAVAAHALDELGRIDAAVTNAGIHGGRASDGVCVARIARGPDRHDMGKGRRAGHPHSGPPFEVGGDEEGDAGPLLKRVELGRDVER